MPSLAAYSSYDVTPSRSSSAMLGCRGSVCGGGGGTRRRMHRWLHKQRFAANHATGLHRRWPCSSLPPAAGRQAAEAHRAAAVSATLPLLVVRRAVASRPRLPCVCVVRLGIAFILAHNIQQLLYLATLRDA